MLIRWDNLIPPATILSNITRVEFGTTFWNPITRAVTFIPAPSNCHTREDENDDDDDENEGCDEDTNCINRPINSARVAGSQTLGTFFARAVGRPTISTGAKAIAVFEPQSGERTSAGCILPFMVWLTGTGGIGSQAGQNGTRFDTGAGYSNNTPLRYGNIITVGKTTGNVGKIDLFGINMSNGSNFGNALNNGQCLDSAGHPAVVSVNDTFTVGPGSSGIGGGTDYWDLRAQSANPYAAIMVNNGSVPPGSSASQTAHRFMFVKLLRTNRLTGNNWRGQFQIVANEFGTIPGSGGPYGRPLARALVQ